MAAEHLLLLCALQKERIAPLVPFSFPSQFYEIDSLLQVKVPSSIDDTELTRLKKELLHIPEESQTQKARPEDPDQTKDRMKACRRGKRRREESSSESSSEPCS